MSDRNRNKLPNNLPQLQNLVKRDPDSYGEEVSVTLSRQSVVWTRANVKGRTNTNSAKPITLTHSTRYNSISTSQTAWSNVDYHTALVLWKKKIPSIGSTSRCLCPYYSWLVRSRHTVLSISLIYWMSIEYSNILEHESFSLYLGLVTSDWQQTFSVFEFSYGGHDNYLINWEI